MSVTYVSAWYCDTPESIVALTTIGMNAFFVPALSEQRVDDVLAAMQHYQVAVIDLSEYGNAYTKIESGLRATAYVERYADHQLVAGFLLFDEPNNSGQSDAFAQQVQRDWYAACKRMAPKKLVYVNYAVGPTIPDIGCILTEPGQGWDQVCVDYYPLTWDVTPEQASVNLYNSARAVRALFPKETAIHWLQQAAGCSLRPETPPWLKPIDGDLEAQYDILDALGILKVSKSLSYYGWGTSPEDRSLKTDAELRAEAARVIAYHRQRYDAMT